MLTSKLASFSQYSGLQIAWPAQLLDNHSPKNSPGQPKKTKHKILTPEETPTGWFDGASQSNGMQSGAGGVIHISPNTLCRWTFNCGQGTNTRAELLGAWATLLLASRLNLDTLLLFGDSRIIIDWLKNKGKLQVTTLLGWKDRIRQLQSSFIKLNFKHIYRENNKEADSLSKAALKKKVESSPSISGWTGTRAPPMF
jgi:ribonuclease HI